MTFRVARDFIGWLRLWFGLFIKDISTFLISRLWSSIVMMCLDFRSHRRAF